MDGMMEVVGMSQEMEAQKLQMQQAVAGASLAKEALQFQGDMVNAIISGGMNAARDAGLAAQGIGSKLSVVV
ncbi:MAG: hypothetical protein IJU37_07050 [Desulfovibrio sp.]|nr:hypothetical protein [Desulfovibrio sp.]